MENGGCVLHSITLGASCRTGRRREITKDSGSGPTAVVLRRVATRRSPVRLTFTATGSLTLNSYRQYRRVYKEKDWRFKLLLHDKIE